MKKASDIPKLVVIATPHDSKTNGTGRFACAKAELLIGAAALIRPPIGDVLITTSLDEVITYAGKHPILVCGEDTLHHGINAWLSRAGAAPIRQDRVEFLDQWIANAGVTVAEGFPIFGNDDLEWLGQHPEFIVGRMFDAAGIVLHRRWSERHDDDEPGMIDIILAKAARRTDEERAEANTAKPKELSLDDDPQDALKATAKPLRGPARTPAERRRILGLDDELRQAVFGQDHAVSDVAEQMVLAKSGLQRPSRPLGSFLFAGPTGVGKTELARQLAVALDAPLVRLDMSEYYDRHSISGLIGAVSGYKDSQRGGTLTNAVISDPNSVVLFDEIEKGHPDVLNLLLQILDAARLTDGRGTVVDFRGTTIVLTTNLGARAKAKRQAMGFTDNDRPEDEDGEINEAIERALPPELRARIDRTMVFNRLTRDMMPRFVGKSLSILQAQLMMTGMGFEASDEAKTWLSRNGYDKNAGARPLERIIDDSIRRPAARLLLSKGHEPGILRVEMGEKNPKVFLDRPKARDTGAKAYRALARVYDARRDEEAHHAETRTNGSTLSEDLSYRFSREVGLWSILLTPADIASIRQDPVDDNEFIAVRVTKCPEGFLMPITQKDLVRTRRPGLIEEAIRGRPCFVFDRPSLARYINPFLEDGGFRPIEPSRVEYLAEQAREVGEYHDSSLFELGFSGGPGMRLPENGAISPLFVAKWACEIINFILGILEQKKLFEL